MRPGLILLCLILVYILYVDLSTAGVASRECLKEENFEELLSNTFVEWVVQSFIYNLQNPLIDPDFYSRLRLFHW